MNKLGDRVTVESIERALDVHKKKGSIRDWYRYEYETGADVERWMKRPYWAVESRPYEWCVYDRKQVNALCIGLANGYTAGNRCQLGA
jgi:hypothetical protein